MELELNISAVRGTQPENRPRNYSRKSFPQMLLLCSRLFWFRLYWIQSWTFWTQLHGGDTKIRPRKLLVISLLSCTFGTRPQWPLTTARRIFSPGRRFKAPPRTYLLWNRIRFLRPWLPHPAAVGCEQVLQSTIGEVDRVSFLLGY